MSKTTQFRQCTLYKPCGKESRAVLVSHIPESFARVGEVLKLKQDDGTWDDGWIVESVGTKTTEPELPDSHTAIKRHRIATGDSLPKMSSSDRGDRDDVKGR